MQPPTVSHILLGGSQSLNNLGNIDIVIVESIRNREVIAMKNNNFIRSLVLMVAGICIAYADESTMKNCPPPGYNALMAGFHGQMGSKFTVVDVIPDPDNLKQYRIVCNYLGMNPSSGQVSIEVSGIPNVTMQGPWHKDGLEYSCVASIDECLFNTNP